MNQTKAHDLNEKVRTKDVLTEEQLNFNALLLSQVTLDGLHNCGFHKPSPIQLKAIPVGKCGFDLIVKSKSGTGKTAVFAIIALEFVNISNHVPQVLVLAPTREIALQIQGVIQGLGSGFKGLKVESFIGGLPLEGDKEKVHGCQIVVGSPGRIKHLIKLGLLNVSSIKLFVLDEVDKLLEENFQSDIINICSHLRTVKQTIASSATYSEELKTYLEQFMCSPTFVTANTESPILLGLKQFVSVVKCNLNVIHQMSIKTEQLSNLLRKVSFSQCLVFTNYQTRAESISNTLNRTGWNSIYISGAQSQAERLKAINSLKEFKCRIVLSTDVTARGIDASNVDLVINYDVPYDASTYLHRMGRAGRYGSHGVCITLIADGKELSDFQRLLGSIGGSSFSVPKLPNEDIPADLWNFQFSKLDVLFGIIDYKDDSHKIKLDILNSVQDLKSSKQKSKVLKEELEHSEEITVEATAHDKSEISCVDINLGDIHTLLDINRKSEEVMESHLSDMDPHILLDTLASGKQLDISLSTTGDDLNAASLLKQATDYVLDGTVDSKKRKRSTIVQHLTYRNEVSNSEFKSDAQTNKRYSQSCNTILFKNIAFLNIAKLLTENFYINTVTDDITKSVETYLNILKKDDDSIINYYHQILKPYTLDEALGLLQMEQTLSVEEITIDKSHDEPDGGTCETTVVQSKDRGNCKENEADTDMENIFKLGFDYATNSEAPYWLDLFGQEFKEKIYLNENEDESSEYTDKDNILKVSPKLRKRRNKHKRHNRSRHYKHINRSHEKCLDDTVQSRRSNDKPVEEYNENQWSYGKNQVYLNYNDYPGLYSEYEYSNNEHFATCFNYYNNELLEQAQNFEDTSSFEAWFSHWQYELQGVRDYVQQNIYLQEMNKYALNRK